MMGSWAADVPGSGAQGIAGISATEQALRVEMACPGRDVRLLELRPYERFDPAADARHPVAWEGKVGDALVQIPRFDGQRDRLYSKFQAVDNATGAAIGPAHYVDDLSAVPAWDFEMPWPESKKGVTCPVDLDDLVTLGVKYTDTNVMLRGVLDLDSENPEETWEVDGQRFGINLGYIRHFDAQIKQMNDVGINVTLILLNGVPTQPDPKNPFIHPKTDLAHAPNHLGSFNLTDEAGLRCYRAVVEYLAHRYSDPSGEHGWVSGYVVGNELQSHWYWHNTGRVSLEDLAREYTTQLRVAWLAVRRYHEHVRVYASMEHHWTIRFDPDPMKSVPGRDLLEGINAFAKAEGDFPWHLAFHPYPENLGNPRFWEDKTAVFGLDSPRITFKNLEVMPAVLEQERFLYRGVRRRIILSEQGLHCPGGPDGEKIQAAAYALAYYKVSRMPEIDAFILHRHVDHRAEGGLHLGLWSCKQDGPDPCAPDKARMIHDVFRLADTEEWEAAFEFAKPIIGIEDWAEADPREDAIPEDSGIVARPLDADAVIHDLYARSREAKVENCLDWRTTWERDADGRLYPTVFQHPPGEGDPVGKATYTVELPQPREGHRIALQFGVQLTSESDDGVRFAVLVDGVEAWSETQTQTRQSTHHQVDLSAHAGKTIRLTLEVDRLENASHDWSTWLRPVVLYVPEAQP